jgi:phosphoribosylformylglycinamidine synthase
VEDVRVGKFMEITLKEIGAEEARRLLDEACRRLLANTVIEEYRIEIGG